MRIIGINASPRRGANTQTLIETALRGAEEKGAETHLVHLRELEMKGCLGCEGCKKQLGRCVQKDGLTPLMQEMTGYDAIVMGTPVYWFHVSAQFKMLVDRLYSFIEMGTDPKTGASTVNSVFPKGKQALFIISRGDPEPTPVFPHFYKNLDEWLHLVPFALGVEKYDFLHQYGAEIDRKAAAGDSDLLDRVKAAGAALVG